MSTISMRLNEEEREILENASKVYGVGVSTMIKKIVFERLEDDYDLKLVAAYEEKKVAGTMKTRPIEEFWHEMGLRDDL